MPRIPKHIKPCICGGEPDFYDFYISRFVCEDCVQRDGSGKAWATPLKDRGNEI